MPRPALKSRAMGMISNVAINLKSRMSHFNSNSETVVNTSGLHSGDHRPSPSPQRGQQPHPQQADFRRSPQNHGEQPPSVIPLTVPGADASMPSFPYGKLKDTGCPNKFWTEKKSWKFIYILHHFYLTNFFAKKWQNSIFAVFEIFI